MRARLNEEKPLQSSKSFFFIIFLSILDIRCQSNADDERNEL